MKRLVIACLLGLLIGRFVPGSWTVDSAFGYVLPVLLFSVGVSLGNVDLRKLVAKNRWLWLLPVFSLVGSGVFSTAYALLVGKEVGEKVLAGSAMGYYSLPAVMVSAQVGVAAGTVLLITNMLREALTIVLAPVVIKLFGKHALVAVGGATTMDVSLAIIKEAGGEEMVPVAIVNGLVLTLGVPLVTMVIIKLFF